jgi:tetratricopeptide (TPR) repeat protein
MNTRHCKVAPSRVGVWLTLCLLAGSFFSTKAHAAPSLKRKAAQLVAEMKQRGEKDGEVHLALGALYAHAGARKKALSHLGAARRNGVKESRVSLVLGGFFRRQGRYDAALTTLVRVLVHNPGQPFALVQLWKALYESRLRGSKLSIDTTAIRKRLGDFGLHFPESFQIKSDASAESKKLAARGYNALLGQRNRYAAGLFKAAIDALPSNAKAHRGLGIAYARQQDFLRASGAYLLYLTLFPNAPDADEIDRVLVRYWKLRSKN